MVITVLGGGLGNQMFQYAAGFALARKRRAELAVYYEPGSERILYNTFPVRAPEVGEEAYRRHYGGAGIPARARRKAQALLPLGRRRYYENCGFNFDKRFFSLGADVLIRGYWQSYRYFDHCRFQIVSEFQSTDSLSEAGALLAEEIRGSNGVGIHVRRGDYADGWTIQDNPYFARALEAIRRVHPSAGPLYVFTNDPEWCAAHLLPEEPKTVVSRAGFPASYDFELMRLCRHKIISNSTFSWWAAYLSDAGGMTAAPAGWTFASYKGFRQDDIYPPEWVVV